MRYKHRIINSLTFRLITPVVITVLLSGLLLYFIVLRSMSDLAGIHIERTLENLSRSVYDICEQTLNDLLRTGMAGDVRQVRIKKGLAIGRIEDFMRENNLTGAIIDGEGKAIFSSENLPLSLAEIVDADRQFSTVKRNRRGYYAYSLRFDPWDWRISIIKDDTEFVPLLIRINLAYGTTYLVLIISALLLFYYVDRSVRAPVSRIADTLKKGEKPDYRGIAEFEYLSNSLREAMEHYERETVMLNNIYHIAASRRGEEFFDEVVIAIGRIYGLNSLIARLAPDGETADVIALYLNGEIKKGMNIPLKGTPCEDALARRHLVVIEKDAYRQYPSSGLTREVRADSYIGSAIFDRNGGVIGIVNAFGKERGFDESDIKVFQTIGQMVAMEIERLDEEREKERIKEELFQAQKMEAIGTLAGGIAHDFNNMLQGILGYASLLKMKVSEDDTMYKPLDVIERSAERAADLTKQLLGFARKGKYVVEPLNLNDIVDEVLKIITRTFDRAIEIKTTLRSDLWIIEGDQSQIEHAVLNLCLNARDAMPAGGLLHIETMNKEITEGELPYLWAKSGRYAAVRVTDTGRGMDDEVKKHIFEPFFTTKEKGKGTGMGLAMVYGVVKNHDGFITVDSEPGRGSTFTIYLPATEREASKKGEVVKEPPHGSGTILIVDDEDDIRGLLRDTLNGLGYETIEASNGEEAVEIYRGQRERIDLIILDLVMPKMSGDEAFHRIKMIDPAVKVLVSSGYGMGEQMRKMIGDAGIEGFVQKPYDINEIAETVKNVLSKGAG
ncbi:MAG: hypothetical protein OHK0032_00070 [Thermodesulfovibrionales bacterium]